MEHWLSESNSCPGLFYGTPAQDGFLIRIRTPGGLLTHQQGRAIATLLENWDRSSIQITNRANLQIRSVHAAPTPDVFQTLQTLGLAAQDPSVDHLRNLMSSPTAGIDPQELIDTRPLVQALDTYIQGHPELATLPAKFSIGIDGGGSVGIGTRSAILWEHRYNEIQLSATEGQGARGKGQEDSTPHTPHPTPHFHKPVYFRLALGADKQLVDTQVLIAPENCVSVVAALATVYLEYVNQASRSRKKPRMKHLLQDWGVQHYLERVNRQLPRPLQQVTSCPELPSTQRYGHLGIHSQRQPGLSYIGVNLQLGQLTADQLLGLVQLSETAGSSHLRLTPWQTVLLPDIPHEQIPEALDSLASLGLPVSNNHVDAAIAACAGKPGCAASATHTQSHAIALANYLNQQLTLECPVNIHLTGCAKSCAQPSPAEITLLGTAIPAKDGMNEADTVEGYHVYVSVDPRSRHTSAKESASLSEQTPFQYHLCDVLSTDISSLIEQLLSLYKQHRKSPNESFEDFISKHIETKQIKIRNNQVKA